MVYIFRKCAFTWNLLIYKGPPQHRATQKYDCLSIKTSPIHWQKNLLIRNLSFKYSTPKWINISWLNILLKTTNNKYRLIHSFQGNYKAIHAFNSLSTNFMYFHKYCRFVLIQLACVSRMRILKQTSTC